VDEQVVDLPEVAGEVAVRGPRVPVDGDGGEVGALVVADGRAVHEAQAGGGGDDAAGEVLIVELEAHRPDGQAHVAAGAVTGGEGIL
jgi:hypothetical protein